MPNSLRRDRTHRYAKEQGKNRKELVRERKEKGGNLRVCGRHSLAMRPIRSEESLATGRTTGF